MKPEKMLKGKIILVVDDEKDVLDTLVDLLDMSRLDTAGSFEEGKTLLENNVYDLVILDIMGVDGYELLEIAKNYKVPAIMLTAHALDEENLVKSIESGSASFIPKEKMNDIAIYAADVLQAIEDGKNPWERWLERLGGYFDRQFSGTEWRKQKEAAYKNLAERYKGVI